MKNLRAILFDWPTACLLAVSAAVHAAGDVTEKRVLAESGKGTNWFLKGGNFDGEHFSPLADISRSNVADLGLAWASEIPAPDGISATPIVVDGVIYFSAAYSVAFAVDAKSGKILWSFDPDVRAAVATMPRMSWLARVNRGVAVWDGKVFVTTADCRLIAVDAASGKELWSKKTCDPAQGYGISDSPYVGGGKVFVGNAGSESHQKTRGYVTAYDADSGKQLWRFFIVPSDRPEENTSAAMKLAAKTWSGTALEEYGGGGNSWNEMTYDAGSGLLFFGTSGAVPYVHSLRSPDGGDNLFLSSVVAVNASSGEYVWHYQTVTEDSWDYNATMNIVLADLEINKEKRETLLIAPKNGFFYVLDKLTGELLSAEKYAKVNWATHINLETGRPVYDPAAEFWNLAEGESAAIWPNMWGAHSWNPMAWHPGEKLAYIPVVDIPSISTNWGGDDYSDTLEMMTEVDGKPFGPGKLVAWDPLSQSARWSVDREFPFNGGVLATAGGLVFQGDALGAFEAFDATSGKLLWRVMTGSAITAAPVSYKVDGKQQVLIPVGAGGGVQFAYPELHAGDRPQGPTRLMAFTLGSDREVPSVAIVPRELPDQPALTANDEQIEEGRWLYADNCGSCHGKNAVARYGGSVPDLRYSSSDVHASWPAIVIGGSRSANGMPSFPLEAGEAEAIRNYLLSLSVQLRKAATSSAQ
ncbi:MAG: PQQ-dependent dehydrogenase, methanol/ethanol family [Gammaproteobacteria bacterium]|nr:PQQ-dependent dehydrogenase, methanol/ethanol family [Gammaproteobacteria bacterium]MDH4315182.1 PQQ-dependent dehydrogenase, methanol/ethanol family [Gammaproteobacteria bacterium]